MRVFSNLAAISVALAITSTSVFADGSRITTEADFRDMIVGKRLNIDGNWFVIQKNGKLRGKFDGKSLRGAWAWKDGYWCRDLSKPRVNSDCQVWETVDGGFRVTRKKGKGNSFVYTLK